MSNASRKQIVASYEETGSKDVTAHILGVSRSKVRRIISEEFPTTSNVLVIGDCHAPCMLPGYVDFLLDIQELYDCDRVVHIGDMVDWASISYHPKAPSLKNSEAEFAKALKQVQALHKHFPRLDYLIGNHDALSERQAADAGLPVLVLKDFNDLWGVPEWNVIPRYGHVEIDNVLYQHGDRGRGGQHNSAFLNAQEEHRSVVQGHFHAQAGVNYFANQRSRVFGMQVGCGCDHQQLAMDYGKKFNKKPIVGCGVVLKGSSAVFHPMEL